MVRILFPFPEEDIRYKQIHCLQNLVEIRLCQDVRESFTRMDGKVWDIQTNSYGERITSSKKDKSNSAKVWLIGDSMSMGYGLPTNETIAFVLETKYQIETRVLAVDAIGTNGILSLYLDALRLTSKENLPTHIYWIWNPSDFIDDEREKKGFRKLIYPIHFYLSRNSLFYHHLIRSPKTNVYENVEPFLYPRTHITYSNLKTFMEETKENKEQWRILFSWGMATSGEPDTKDPNYESEKDFFEREGRKTIDLRNITEVQFAQKKKIYIPEDGHPDRDLAAIFADAIASDYRKSK